MRRYVRRPIEPALKRGPSIAHLFCSGTHGAPWLATGLLQCPHFNASGKTQMQITQWICAEREASLMPPAKWPSL